MLTCTILLMTMGSMLRGKRRMLKRARDTKAFWASSTFCSSTRTYTAKVDKATCKNRQQGATARVHHLGSQGGGQITVSITVTAVGQISARYGPQYHRPHGKTRKAMAPLGIPLGSQRKDLFFGLHALD